MPATASEFDLQARRLGLTEQTYAASAQLRTWCERNKNRFYIPEWLLAERGITVDPNVIMERRAANKKLGSTRSGEARARSISVPGRARDPLNGPVQRTEPSRRLTLHVPNGRCSRTMKNCTLVPFPRPLSL